MKKFFSLIAAVLFAGSMMADNFVPVTDASTLADGDQIIITDVNAAAAISTLQKSNNRGVTTVELTDGVIVVFPGANVQIITLVAAEANFMLQVGEDAYLYAASNSSNHLKTANAETVGDNGKFAISITEGVASVIAQGTNSRNDLRYNSGSSCFSCYGSSTSIEAGLKIFKKEGGEIVPPTPADTYTVAGSDEAIFGSPWDEALDANDMVLKNGIYTWEKEVALEIGMFSFKVVKNHDWEIAYPSSNYEVTIAEAGTYTITITFDPATETVAAEAVKKVIPQYEVAEALAAGLTDNTEIFVRGVITKMEIKGKNFASYGSVNIYVADATGAAGEFEFYNCYSLNADTFLTTVPAYDAASTAWLQLEEVADGNGNTIHLGDTVIAFGKYKLYSGTHELNTGCYLTDVKEAIYVPAEEYYLTGSFRNWAVTADEDLHFVANPAAAGEYMLQGIALAANAEIKVIGILDENVSYYPGGMDNNYQVAVDSVYDIYFRPDGQGGEGWHYGYFYVVGAPVVVPPTAISCLDVYQMAKGDVVDLLNDVVVTFANGKNVWVRDGSASMLIYFSANTTYAPGDVLSGIAGTVDIYNGVTEIKPSADQAAAIVATPGEVPAAIQTVVVEAADVNKYIVMPEIEFEEDAAFVEGTASNITMNGVVVRNNFKNGYAFEAGRKYNIYGVVTIYQNNPQVYFITAEKIIGTAIDNTNIDAKVIKTIENGQLIIIKNGVRYNAQGAVVR